MRRTQEQQFPSQRRGGIDVTGVGLPGNPAPQQGGGRRNATDQSGVGFFYARNNVQTTTDTPADELPSPKTQKKA